MRKTVGTCLTVGLGAILTLLTCADSTLAQYVVSARAGMINYTQGEVVYKSSTGMSWEKLARQDQLDNGDHVVTGSTGRVEILLNPGSVLRLDRSSEAVLVETNLPLIEIELLSGRGILEAGELNTDITLRLKTPQATLRIKDDGLFRIDVAPSVTRISTRKGSLEVLAGGRVLKVKKGNAAEIREGAIHLAKANDPMDDFDLWAQDRAETMLAANLSLTRRRNFTEWAFLRAGSWVYDPVFGFFTYVPFGYFYRSPWGRTFVYCPYGYYDWWGNPYGYPGGSVTGGSRDRVPSAPSLTPTEAKLGLRVNTDRLNRSEGFGARPPALNGGGRGRIPTDDGFGRMRGTDIQLPPPSSPAERPLTPVPGPVLSGPKGKGRTSQ